MCAQLFAGLVICLFLSFPAIAEEDNTNEFDTLFSNLEVHGFYELRGGYRTQNDKYEKDMSVMEQRLQVDLSSYLDWADFKFKGDTIGDLVEGDFSFDLREGSIAMNPLDFMDVKAGRHTLTWGTGDLIFINDLFPKDWQSFFIGRDTEYLKAPSDAIKTSFFHEIANLDIVYSPQFNSDRFISGRRVSYWNSNLGRQAGRDAIQHTDKPDDYFKDDEIAARLYKNISNYEFALYSYHGFWKSPGGQNASGTRAIFPDLNVYGSSLRGAVGKGIGNVEFGYYESVDDKSGKKGNINNSEVRILAGYTQEVGKDFTAGVQYYLEHMLQYGNHKDSMPSGLTRDRNRHLITVRLTKLLMNQNLRCSVFTYFSPSDKDAYIRPNIHYKVNDSFAVECGANVFFGDYPDTFFGQFEKNTNIYTAVRYSF